MTTANDPPLTHLGRALEEVDELKETVIALTGTINTEQATKRRFWMNLGVLVVLASLIMFGIGRINTITNRLDSCLIAGGECYNRLAREGSLGSNRIMDFNGCMFLIEPHVRVPADVDACKQEADKKFFASLNSVADGE